MNAAEQMALCMGITRTLFNSKIAGTDITTAVITTNAGKFPGRLFVNGTVRGFDFKITAGTKIIPLRIIEQNPNKKDEYGNFTGPAILAQQGKRIAWLIRRDTNEFMGKFQYNDKTKVYDFTKSEPKAITRATLGNGGYTHQQITAQDQYGSEYNEYDTGFKNVPEIDPSEIAVYVSGI